MCGRFRQIRSGDVVGPPERWRPVPSAGMVGRVDAVRRLRAAMSQAAEGDTTAVFVAGEAGMGKTALLRAAVAALPEGAVVGWGTCSAQEGAPGFWPWSQALGGIVRAVGLDEAVAQAGAERDRLGLVARELARPTVAREPVDDRFLLLDAVCRWLSEIAAARLVVVVLDDLQWADASTLDLLDHLLAVPRPGRLLVLGSYRDDGPDVPRVHGLADRLRLSGLSLDDVAELASRTRGAPVGPEEARALLERTRGHPMFVKELSTWEPGTELPPAVTAALRRRLDSVPEQVRVLLRVASLLGNRVLPDVLAAALGLPMEHVARDLARAAAAGIVSPVVDGEAWFAHDLHRETLQAAVASVDLPRLHARLGLALESRLARGGDVAPEDVARHLTLGVPDLGAGPALAWASRAALSERRRSAFDEAAGHLRRAREAAASAGLDLDPAVLVGLLLDEADARARSGQPATARDVLARAADMTTDPRLRADVALAVQRLGAKFAAPRSDVVALLEEARAGVSGVDRSRSAKVTAALARELRHSVPEDRERAGPLSEEALALGRLSADDGTVMACLLARHDVLWSPGTGPARVSLAREIATIAARLGDADHLAEALVLEANAHLESGSAAFRPVLDRWFGLMQARDEPRDQYLVATRRAALALLDGDPTRAEPLMLAAAQLGEQVQEPDTGNVLMSQRVALAGLRDDPEELRRLAADAVAWWTGAPLLAHAVAAGALARCGDLDQARTEIATVSAAGGWRAETSYLSSVLVSHLAEAAVAVRDLPLCDELLDHVTPLADACGVNGAVVAFAGPYAHTTGLLLGALGDREAAEAMLRRSLRTARSLGAWAWVRTAEAALAGQARPSEDLPGASWVRRGPVWEIAWRTEHAVLPHRKGMADLATLLQHQHRPVPALVLAGGVAEDTVGDELIDVRALRAYRDRLVAIEDELATARQDEDGGRLAVLGDERELLLAEVRRATGLGGRLRTSSAVPSERARKAVSARIRDAIAQVATVAPSLAAHLDRSVQTGLRCVYDPGAGETVRWSVET